MSMIHDGGVEASDLLLEDQGHADAPFVILTHEWLRRWLPVLTQAELRVYCALAVHFRPGRHAMVWPHQGANGSSRQKGIAANSGIGRRQTIIAAIHILAKHELIDVIDWPIEIGGRQIGGGARRGRGCVYRLLHVDERGHHRAGRIRPTAAELLSVQNEMIDLCGVMMRGIRDRGWQFNELRQALRDFEPEYVRKSTLWREAAPSPNMDPEGFDPAADIPVAAVAAMWRRIDKRWPEDRVAPFSQLVFHHPNAVGVEELGRRCLGLGPDGKGTPESTGGVRSRAQGVYAPEHRGCAVQSTGGVL